MPLSFGTVCGTAIPGHIPLQLLVKVIVYFFHQKNKRRCTQYTRALSCVRALFDLRRALMEKNHPVMDVESEKTLPAQHSFGGIIWHCHREGPPRVLWGQKGRRSCPPGEPGSRQPSDHQEPKPPPWEVGGWSPASNKQKK